MVIISRTNQKYLLHHVDLYVSKAFPIRRPKKLILTFLFVRAITLGSIFS